MAPVVVFVDPAAGHKGVHNLGFVDVLLAHSASTKTPVALAAHRKLDSGFRLRLRGAGVEVLDVFETDAYQYNNQQPAIDALVHYTMQLAQEYEALMKQVAQRWPGRTVCWVFHTSPWQHLQALSVAVRGLPQAVLAHWQFHVYLMYWHGMDHLGVAKDSSLRLRYRVALSGLARLPGVRFFSSSHEYVPGYQALLGSVVPVAVHPYFLGDWLAQPATLQATPRVIRHVLAYSGDVREIKGFMNLHGCVLNVLQRFEHVRQVQVHTTLAPTHMDKRLGEVWDQLHSMARQDSRLVLQEGFLSHAALMALLGQVDLLVLNYDAVAYEHKTSGFVWLAAQLGVPCAVTANTWLEREAVRLGVRGWRITANGDWEPLDCLPEKQVALYRQEVLQPYWAWLSGTLLIDHA